MWATTCPVDTSTMSVHYRKRDWYPGEEMTPLDTPSAYGMTKGLGEQICAYFARWFDMRIIALRITGPRTREQYIAERKNPIHPGLYVTDEEDLARAYLAAIEAVIAAIYLDAGLEAARAEVLTWYAGRLLTHLPENAQKDAKTELQEYLQARRKPLPVYNTVEISGPPHQRVFRVACALPDRDPAVAEGDSRRRAEQSAARLMLESFAGRGA